MRAIASKSRPADVDLKQRTLFLTRSIALRSRDGISNGRISRHSTITASLNHSDGAPPLFEFQVRFGKFGPSKQERWLSTVLESTVLEMLIVKPPVPLDFASAYLDQPPDYPAEVIEEWQREKTDLFEERWLDVQLILFELEKLGIYLRDV